MFVENPEGRRRLGDIGIEEKIILKCILRKESVRVWSGLVAGSFEHGTEPLDSIKGRGLVE
jgi:hypothetical protein